MLSNLFLRAVLRRSALAIAAWSMSGVACAAPDDSLTAALACFHGTVHLESACAAVDGGGLHVECTRQTLRTDAGQSQIVGVDKALHAIEWGCSADRRTLFVRLANGGSCAECEQVWMFDERARRLRRAPGRLPALLEIQAVATR